MKYSNYYFNAIKIPFYDLKDRVSDRCLRSVKDMTRRQEKYISNPAYLIMTMPENIQNLRRVKIYFDNEKDEENGFYDHYLIMME